MRPYDKPLPDVKPLKLREVLIDMFRIQIDQEVSSGSSSGVS
jgi:hypothetical protein